MFAKKYIISPWYVKPTLKNRWGLAAWETWLNGGILPGDGGNNYFPQGFVASELGTTALTEFGKEKMAAERQKLESGQCYFLCTAN